MIKNNNMKNLMLLALALLLGFGAFGQKEKKVVIKKDKVIKVDVENDSNSEKTMNVSIDEEDGKRKIIIKTNENGDEKVIEWMDNGEIPDEIKKQLEAEDINISVLNGGNAVFIGDGDIEKEVIMIKDHDDKTIELEWDGEGEIPSEMKKIIKEHDLDLSELKEGAKGKKMKMKMLKMDKRHKGPNGRHNVWHAKEMTDTYMGAQIGTGNGGTEILDVMVDSPAHKAGLKKGDLIKEINGANTANVDDMMTLLSFFDVDDEIEIEYERDGKMKKTNLTLAQRPAAYR